LDIFKKSFAKAKTDFEKGYKEGKED